MSTPVAIATSDWHLDLHAWADRPEIAGDALESFRQITAYALRFNLPILAAGDLLDRKANFATLIHEIRPVLDKLAAANIPLLFTQGQHEAQPVPWLTAVHHWPTWLQAAEAGLQLGPFRLAGLDWQPRDDLAAKLDRVPQDTNILLLHQVCHEFMGGIALAEMDFGQVPFAKLLLVGDYHEHISREARGRQGQLLKVLSPGSTNMRKIDEPPVKMFFVIYDDLTVKSVRLRTRPVLHRDVLSPEDLDHFVETISQDLQKAAETATLTPALRKPLLRVRYRDDVPEAYSRIVTAVGDQGHLFTKILRAATEAWEEGEETYDEVTDLGLVGCLPLLVSEDEEPEVFQLSQQLLASQDLSATLASARAKYFSREGDSGE